MSIISPYYEATFSRDFVDSQIQRQLIIVHTAPDKEKQYAESFSFTDQSMRYDFDIRTENEYTTEGHTILIEPGQVTYTQYKLPASRIATMTRNEKEEKHIWTSDESGLITQYEHAPLQKIKRDSVRSSKRPENIILTGDEAIEQFESFRLPFVDKRNKLMPYGAVNVDYASLKSHLPVRSKFSNRPQRLFSKKQDAFIRYMQGKPAGLKECVDMYYNTQCDRVLKMHL